MRYAVPAVALPILLLAGCGASARPKAVPDLRGQRLDVAERQLLDRGLDYQEVGGGSFGIVARSHWTVCDQRPLPRAKATKVRLIVARSCPGTAAVVPDVVGENLDDAGDELEARGISYDAADEDGDTPIIEHLWEVCDQDPPAGTHATHMDLTVARICWDD
jgi:beta-lactam-binding protein with PASTA domain